MGGRATKVLEGALPNPDVYDDLDNVGVRFEAARAYDYEVQRGEGDNPAASSLEARSMGCLVRLLGMMTWRYPRTSSKEEAALMRVSLSPSRYPPPDEVDDDDEKVTDAEEQGQDAAVALPPHFGTLEWSAAHVRLGELQTLEAVRTLAAGGGGVMWADISRREAASSSYKSL